MFDCMYTLSCLPLYTYLALPYLTCSTLLYLPYRWSVLWILHFSSLPFFAYVEDKLSEKFSNGILIMNFLFCFLLCF